MMLTLTQSRTHARTPTHTLAHGYIRDMVVVVVGGGAAVLLIDSVAVLLIDSVDTHTAHMVMMDVCSSTYSSMLLTRE